MHATDRADSQVAFHSIDSELIAESYKKRSIIQTNQLLILTMMQNEPMSERKRLGATHS